jgi:hypothetical protein
MDMKGYIGLGADVNKQKGEPAQETQEGVVSDKLPELRLEMKDEDIAKLAKNWEKAWVDSSIKSKWDKQIEENEKYWLGSQFQKAEQDDSRSMVDNLIFEALETYLPQTTRRNPEPLVMIDPKDKLEEPNPEYEKYVTKVKERLSDLADKNKLRLKLKKVARHWAIYHVGIIKFGWDLDKDIPTLRVIRPKKIILDPESTIDEDGYTGNRIGEYREMEASRILSIMEKNDASDDAKKLINETIKDNDEKKGATEIKFIEWWTSEFMFWKLKDQILLKRKNMHWNYDEDRTRDEVDEFGNVAMIPETQRGINHLPIPDMPYRFLSVYNLGKQPMDDTSLISQNLSNQDLINKRNRQIDKNVDNMNGGMVVSLGRSGLTSTQAKGVSKALRKGGVVVIPDGAPREAIDRYPGTSLPADVFTQLLDTRTRLRDIFGTSGSTPAGVKQEETVRGKIQIRGLDTDRIGGGVSEYLEQLSDDIYNYLYQLLLVYDSGFQFLEERTPPKLTISVKEGSLLPKDSISIANQALDLAKLDRISNLDLYKRLEYPNPEELAANVWLEKNAPHVLYKDNPQIQEALGIQQAQAQEEVGRQEEQENMKHQRELEKEQFKKDRGAESPEKSPVAEIPVPRT